MLSVYHLYYVTFLCTSPLGYNVLAHTFIFFRVIRGVSLKVRNNCGVVIITDEINVDTHTIEPKVSYVVSSTCAEVLDGTWPIAFALAFTTFWLA